MVLAEQDYQDLIDARDHAIALRAVADGADTLSEAEAIEYLAARPLWPSGASIAASPRPHWPIPSACRSPIWRKSRPESVLAMSSYTRNWRQSCG